MALTSIARAREGAPQRGCSRGSTFDRDFGKPPHEPFTTVRFSRQRSRQRSPRDVLDLETTVEVAGSGCSVNRSYVHLQGEIDADRLEVLRGTKCELRRFAHVPGRGCMLRAQPVEVRAGDIVERRCLRKREQPSRDVEGTGIEIGGRCSEHPQCAL
jgi:hypothetical protein